MYGVVDRHENSNKLCKRRKEKAEKGESRKRRKQKKEKAEITFNACTLWVRLVLINFNSASL